MIFADLLVAFVMTAAASYIGTRPEREISDGMRVLQVILTVGTLVLLGLFPVIILIYNLGK